MLGVEEQTGGVPADDSTISLDVVVLLASAGGLEALSVVLAHLPKDFRPAVLVHQHLGGHASVLPSILSRRTDRQVSWVTAGHPLRPGQVRVCPPGVYVEIGPDRTCLLSAGGTDRGQRFDVLLASVARTYGSRALAVVLSGSGRDGADGTRAMKRAGGMVIAQSEDTALYPSMPAAAAAAGAHAVLPLYDIGRVLSDIDREALDAGEIRDRLAGLSLGRADHPGWTPPGASAEEAGSMQAGSAGESVAGRLAAVRSRTAELKRRREQLAAGQGSTPQTVAAARRRALESLRRASRAYQAAARRGAAKPPSDA